MGVASASAQSPGTGAGFGNLGWRVVGGGDEAVGGIVVRADGRIVVATGTEESDAFLPDGSIDRSFGSNGVARGRRDECQCGWTSAAAQADGKIVVAQGGTLIRFTRRGVLDAKFGTRGRVLLGPGRASGVAVAPDGRIIVGFVDEAAPSLRAFHPDGTRDVRFGVAGRVPVAPLHEGELSVAVQPDGKIVVAAAEVDPARTTDVPLSRYLADGSLDTSFGTDGRAHADDVRGDTVALQVDGKILVAGLRVIVGVGPETDVLRFSPDGRLDPTFGQGGVIRRRVQGLVGWPRAIAPLPGRAVAIAGGWIVAACCKGEYWFAARVTPEGIWRDGPAPGLIDPEHDCYGEDATALAVQPDGKILVGGSTCSGNRVGRYTPELELDAGESLIVDSSRLRAFAVGGNVRILGNLRVSDKARVTVSVGGARLLSGSRLGQARLAQDARALSASVRRPSLLPLRLVLAGGARIYTVRVRAADARGRMYDRSIRVKPSMHTSP